MKVVRKGLPVLILVALALTPAPAASPLPPNPHQSMSASTGCSECHAFYGEVLDPHEFVVAIPEKCWACHSKKSLGRSHPIGVDPSDAPAGVVEVPEDLPLENGKVSCGSCHEPHMAFLSKTKAFPDQEVTFRQKGERGEISWYKTFYLRISDPKKGFEPLCIACHKDY